MIKKAIIPAAGLGTRFLPATKAQPKEMLPIVDKPAIQYIVEEAVASGIEDILIITGRNKRAIEDHFDRSIELELLLEKKEQIETLESIKRISSMANIHYIRQKEALGLGHAILTASHFVGKEAFAVLLGDDIIRSEVPALTQLIRAYQMTNSAILGVQRVPDEDTSRYGILKVDLEQGQNNELLSVQGVVEKPSSDPPSNLAIVGRYILTPEIFTLLSRLDPGYGGEIQLSDALHILTGKEPVYAKQIDGRRYDIGDTLGFLKANIEIAMEREDVGEKLTHYLNERFK